MLYFRYYDSCATTEKKGLLKAFKKYQERYLTIGRKPDLKKFLPEVLYRTMRLEGEAITQKEAHALFRQ